MIPDLQLAPELIAAADYWTEIIRRPPAKENGDPIASAMGSIFSDRQARPSEEQIARFRDVLLSGLVAEIGDRWYPDNPSRGSYLRTIGSDYGPSPVIAQALRAAGMKTGVTSLMPWKTWMTVNPGRVTVRGIDHDTVIYPEPAEVA